MTAIIRPRPLLTGLALLLLLVFWLSLALGPVSLPLGETWLAGFRLLGLPLDGADTQQAQLILGQIRLPRSLLGIAVGSVLALSGVAMQGLFRSHLPEYVDYYVVAAVPVAFFAAALVGMAMERTVIRHLYGRPLETLLAT